MTNLPPELRDAEEHDDPRRAEIQSQAAGVNPRWFVPLMVGLLVVGILWVVVYYVTQGQYPIGSIGQWNVAVGMGLLMSGFVLATRWQ
ncbi:Uncharacterised protein family (UPF0233) [Kytococcus aerolatus]|uniref:Cell division protein CrgA n=1 Tax=Kytococcus aerolatus TaxID=592308 RepID=A0A212TH74_9MICO|nr:cell division protein CrgA [Kytococcus aerolatus]SNC65166.1 Uncharacterised protein family (UPF0233) [Kytococcus aerolatus]